MVPIAAGATTSWQMSPPALPADAMLLKSSWPGAAAAAAVLVAAPDIVDGHCVEMSLERRGIMALEKVGPTVLADSVPDGATVA